jgi:hypothetical protein
MPFYAAPPQHIMIPCACGLRPAPGATTLAFFTPTARDASDVSLALSSLSTVSLRKTKLRFVLAATERDV